MRFKLTIFLIVANIITFGLVWKNAGGNAETEITAQSLFSSDISGIAVRTATNDVSLLLEKRDRDWFLTEPFTWRADAFAVNRLLNELRFLDSSLGFSAEEVADAGNTLESYGLQKTAAVVSVKDASGTHELRIGKTTPDGRSVYVLSPDGRFIIPAPISLLNAVSVQPAELRVREIFSMRPYEVRAITVRTAFSGGSEQRVGFVRSRVNVGGEEKSVWRFETPIATAADTQLTEKRLGELTALTYSRFVSGNAAPSEATGLRVPRLRFTLEAADRSRTLLVGNADPEDASGETVFAKLEDNPAIFTVSAETVNAWRTAVRDMRDPYFLNFEPADLSSIRIYDGQNSIVLHRMNVLKSGETAASAGTTASAATTGTGTAAGTTASANADGTVEPKVFAETSSEKSEVLGNAVAVPRPEIFSTQNDAASNPLYNAWQMPVAPGSSVTSALPVDPKTVAELIERLRNLRATRAPGADDSSQSASRRRLCEAFVADVATPEDISMMKFYTPLRIVELEFSQKSAAGTKTQTLTIAPAAEDGTPIHAKTGTAIYSITSDILENLSVSPAYFRDKIVYTLPSGGKIVSIKISELSDIGLEKTILNEKCPDTAANWAEALEGNAEPFPQALAKLLRATETVVAEAYLPKEFSRDFTDTEYLGMDVPERWRYKIEIGVRLAAGEKSSFEKIETITYYLTRRLGGTTQLAGSPAQNCIFKIRQDFIDAMHTLTFNSSGIIPNIADPTAVPTEKIDDSAEIEAANAAGRNEEN